MVSADGQRWSAGRMVSVARAQRREELGELGVDVGEAQLGSEALIHAIANPRRPAAFKPTRRFSIFWVGFQLGSSHL